jgi:hypothetical protein
MGISEGRWCMIRFHRLWVNIEVQAFWGLVLVASFLGSPNFADAETPSKNEKIGSPADEENVIQSTYLITQQQLAAYRKKLEESEGALQEFQRQHGIVLLETQISHLLDQRRGLDESLKNAQKNVMASREKLAWVQEQIKQVPSQIPLSDTSREASLIAGAKTNLLNLQLKEYELLNKYTETSPHVQAVRKEIELINQYINEQQERLDRSVTTGKNPLYQEMEMELFRTQGELVSAEAQMKGIRTQIEEVNGELERLRSLRPELDELKRQVMADERNYISYLAKVGKTPTQDYQIQVGDQLDIKFFFNPELNETVLVRPDGRIALQLVGEIPVVGNTVSQIRKVLIKNYAGQLKNPEIAVLLRASDVIGDGVRQSPGSEGMSGDSHAE